MSALCKILFQLSATLSVWTWVSYFQPPKLRNLCVANVSPQQLWRWNGCQKGHQCLVLHWKASLPEGRYSHHSAFLNDKQYLVWRIVASCLSSKTTISIVCFSYYPIQRITFCLHAVFFHHNNKKVGKCTVEGAILVPEKKFDFFWAPIQKAPE